MQIVGPITSTYRWQGKIETGEEWQCWAKTRGELFARVEEAIRRIHPYEVPEILAVPVVAGSARYLAWLEAEIEQLKSVLSSCLLATARRPARRRQGSARSPPGNSTSAARADRD